MSDEDDNTPILSPDLLSQILSRLPIPSLLRFRSVSKTLKTLIDSHYFSFLHLHHSLLSNSNSILLFGGDRSLSFLNLDSPLPPSTTTIHNPLYFSILQTVVLGSCNGIVCLCTPEPDNEFAFWNPVVRKFIKTILPPAKSVLGFGPTGISISIKGFGYDPVNNDYKIVRLVQYCKTRNNSLFKELVYSKLEVFSLKSEEWKEIGDFPYYLCCRRYLNVYVSGGLHWLVSESGDMGEGFLIMAVDLTKEEVREVPQPEIVKCESLEVSLGVLGGCLAMVCSYPDDGKVDVWVMGSYGVRESWRRLISTADGKIVKDLEFLRPIVYSKSGREVLLEKNFERLYWYDVGNKTVRRLKVAGMPRMFVTEMFTGSLVQVSIGGASSSRSVKKKEENEDRNNKKKDDFLSEGFRLVL